MANVVRGTPAELAERLTVNGHSVTQQDVHFLTRLGDGVFAKQVGTKRTNTGRGGKPATIWEIRQNASFKLKEEEVGTSQNLARNPSARLWTSLSPRPFRPQ